MQFLILGPLLGIFLLLLLPVIKGTELITSTPRSKEASRKLCNFLLSGEYLEKLDLKYEDCLKVVGNAGNDAEVAVITPEEEEEKGSSSTTARPLAKSAAPTRTNLRNFSNKSLDFFVMNITLISIFVMAIFAYKKIRNLTYDLQSHQQHNEAGLHSSSDGGGGGGVGVGIGNGGGSSGMGLDFRSNFPEPELFDEDDYARPPQPQPKRLQHQVNYASVLGGIGTKSYNTPSRTNLANSSAAAASASASATTGGSGSGVATTSATAAAASQQGASANTGAIPRRNDTPVNVLISSNVARVDNVRLEDANRLNLINGRDDDPRRLPPSYEEVIRSTSPRPTYEEAVLRSTSPRPTYEEAIRSSTTSSPHPHPHPHPRPAAYEEAVRSNED